jgi:hypothetical protein
MHLIWILLALGPLVLFGLVAATWTVCMRLVAMRAFLWFALVSLAGAEGLGAFGAISTPAMRIFWGAVAAGCSAVVAFRLRRGHRISWGKPRLLASSPYGWWIVLSLAITLFIAVTAVPNSWDSMSYHLPRIEHWLQNGSLAFYPTHNDRENDLGPLTEIIMLQWRAITGGDRLTALVQWLAMAGSLTGIGLITSRLGGDERAQLLSLLFCATLPVGLLLGTSTKNEHVMTFFVICFIERLIEARRTLQRIAVIEAALAIVLGILAQPTAIIWGFPFGIWFAAPLIWHPRRAAAVLGLFVLVAVVPGLGHYGRLMKAYGTFVPPAAKVTNSASFGVGQTMDALLLHSASELASPYDRVNMVMLSMINRVSAALGWSEHREDTVFQYTPVQFPNGSSIESEDSATNPLHFGIAITSLITGLWWLARGRLCPLGGYSLSCIAGYLLFVSLIRWQPWVTRLHLPLLAAASPMVGMVGTKLRGVRPLVDFLVLTLCVSSWLFLIGNPYRPLWPHPYLIDDPIDTMFVRHPGMLRPYKSMIDHIRDVRCRQIGLLPPVDDYLQLYLWEFPYWYALRDELADGVRIEDVFPGQAPVTYPLGPFHPGCIVVTKQGEPLQPFTYDGALWTETNRSGPIALYEKSVGN